MLIPGSRRSNSPTWGSPLEGIATPPVFVADLHSEDDRVRASQLSTLPCVVIGTSPEAHEFLLETPCDLYVTQDAEAPRPWVGGGEETLELVLASVISSPQASVVLVQLLRLGRTLTRSDAVLAESLAYGLLQQGQEHLDWVTSRTRQPQEPRSTEPAVLLSRDSDRLLITLNRPEKRNAVNSELRDLLKEGFDLALDDNSIESIELRAHGPSFCAGGDLEEFGTVATPVVGHLIRTGHSLAQSCCSCSDRLVTWVHGASIGAGIELAAFSSHVTATPDATFCLPECSMGLIPGSGGTASIPFRIGAPRTAYLALTGQTIDARTALRWGLIDELSDPEGT